MEKIFRKTPTIVSKEEYVGYYSEVGNVKVLEADWKIFDIKELLDYLNKVAGISDLKRIRLRKNHTKKREKSKYQSHASNTTDLKPNLKFKNMSTKEERI